MNRNNTTTFQYFEHLLIRLYVFLTLSRTKRNPILGLMGKHMQLLEK
jgi:hypothetical protein